MNPGSGEPLRKRVDRLQGEVAELRASRRRLVDAADADRRAIERGLHDSVQQQLVAIAVDLQRLARLLEVDPSAARALLDEIAANVRQAIDETAQLAQTIYPPLLGSRGLTSALRSAAQLAGVTILVDVPARTAFPSAITDAIYWSCAEMLSSAPPASQATVRVLEAEGSVTFEIGIAGHIAEGSRNRVSDRIEALGGRIAVDDGHDDRSSVHVWLPLSG